MISRDPETLTGLTQLLKVIVATPIQGMAMKKMFAFRKKAMVWTDKRAKLIQELLNGIKVIKFFGER
jgi:hypothetical protein